MFLLSVFRRCCPWRSARRKPFVDCCGNLVALQGRTIVTSVSSDARHCSCSSSRQRYSRSHKRDRHSRSNCCPTAKQHGCEGFLPGLISTCKVTNFIRLFDHCLYLFLMNSSKKMKRCSNRGLRPTVLHLSKFVEKSCYERTIIRPRKARRAPSHVLELETA